MKAFDFFCGAGDLSRGLLDAGIDVVAGIDFDQKCQKTYEHNNLGAVFIHSDIRKIQVKDLTRVSKVRKFNSVLFAGCAPCQSFSQQRKQGEKRRDSTLLKEFGRLVKDALPGYVLIENVPGLAKVAGNSTFRRFVKMLENNDYSCSFDVLNAKHFGVPQNRRRLVLIASKKEIASLPELKYGDRLEDFQTVRDAISRYPAIASGESCSKIPNHHAASISALNLERIRSTPHDGGDRRAWSKKLFLECHKKNTKVTQMFMVAWHGMPQLLH